MFAVETKHGQKNSQIKKTRKIMLRRRTEAGKMTGMGGRESQQSKLCRGCQQRL